MINTIFVDGRGMTEDEFKTLEESLRQSGKKLKKISENEYHTIQLLED